MPVWISSSAARVATASSGVTLVTAGVANSLSSIGSLGVSVTFVTVAISAVDRRLRNPQHLPDLPARFQLVLSTPRRIGQDDSVGHVSRLPSAASSSLVSLGSVSGGGRSPRRPPPGAPKRSRGLRGPPLVRVPVPATAPSGAGSTMFRARACPMTWSLADRIARRAPCTHNARPGSRAGRARGRRRAWGFW